jgi:predicted enzyme related to lactoylglutathione lyase
MDRMKQTNIIAIILLVLGLSACATIPSPTINPPITWIPKFATPGVRLTFQEQSQTTVEGRPAVTYSVDITGLPKDKTYALWQKWLDGKIALFGQFHFDDSGVLVGSLGSERSINQKMPLSKVTFHFYQMFRGEPANFALVSTDIDQTVKAFANFVPFPLQAKGDGGCSLSMELLSQKGRLFGFMVEGFKPDEEVTTVSKSGGEILEEKQKAPADGRFAAIGDPGVIGSAGGSASFQASGKACEVILNYEWGTAMKVL